MMAMLVGTFASLAGIVFLYGCFQRLDSAAFLERAQGDEAKVAKLRSMQAAWDALGRLRQVTVSSLALLMLGSSLLLLRFAPSSARYVLVVPVSFAALFVAVWSVHRFAKGVLVGDSHGETQVLGVIRQNLWMCFTFPLVVLAFAGKI